MADKNVQLKCGEDLLFPRTNLEMVQGLLDEDTGKIDTALLPKTGIDIKYNNGMIQTGVTQINFAGTVTVEKTADGVVKARIGENQNSSNFGTTDGVTAGTVTTSGLTTKSMIMTTASDSSWGIGDWAAGSSHTGVNKATTNNLTITTQGNIHFDEAGSSFVVQLIKWDGTTLATNAFTVDGATGAVTPSGDSNITCSIASYGDQTNVPAAVGKMGKPTFVLALHNMLPDGGRFKVKITHNNGTQGAFTWTMDDLFFNAGVTPTLSSAAVSLAEGYSTVQLSGVTYISGGTLTVTVASIGNLNKRAASATKVGISGSYTNSYTYNAAHLTGYHLNQNNAPSFSASLTLASNKSLAGAVSVSINATNAFATSGNTAVSTGSLLIDTLNAGTTNATSAETFKTETYRLTSSLEAWDSSTSLADNDGLQQIAKTLKYPSVNYSTYTPAGPDYRGFTGFRYYLRSFTFSGTKFGGTFTFGNLAESDLDASKLTLEISKNGTDWYDITQTNVQAQNGIRVFAGTVQAPKLQFAFDDGAATDIIYLRIGMNNTFNKAITSLAFA